MLWGTAIIMQNILHIQFRWWNMMDEWILMVQVYNNYECLLQHLYTIWILGHRGGGGKGVKICGWLYATWHLEVHQSQHHASYVAEPNIFL